MKTLVPLSDSKLKGAKRSEKAFRQWLDAQKLPYYQKGKLFFCDDEELSELIRQCRVAPKSIHNSDEAEAEFAISRAGGMR